RSTQRTARPFAKRRLVGQWPTGEGGRFYVAGWAAGTGHAVAGDAAAAELRPAQPAVPARAAALVVVIHHAPADERRIDAGADGGDDATRLVTGDDGSAAAETERRRGVACRALGMQVAAAH